MKLPILIDIDGVLRSGSFLLPGTQAFIHFLRENAFPFCLLSNSTKTGREDLIPFFEERGIQVDFPIITALDVTKAYLETHYHSAKVFAIPSAFKWLDILPRENPEVIVVGDLGPGFTYPVLNEMLRDLMAGAELLAMQQNPFGRNEQGHYLDAGSFIAALEYGSGKKAKLLGKPSPSYFDAALKLIGSSINSPFVMIGDDLKVDVHAAMQLGGTGILMLTGKTSKAMLEAQQECRPDLVAENLSEVIQWIVANHGN